MAVRCRPLLSKEKVEHAQNCLRFPSDRQIVLGKDRAFTFDFAFSESIGQEQVYTQCCAKLAEGCFSGYNATILAYGQTGSGKTYTMGSSDEAGVLEGEIGIIPRAVMQLFEGVRARKDQVEFVHVSVEMLELYNEEIRDLLHPDTPSKAISIRETPAGDIIVIGVKDQTAHNVEEVLTALENGAVCRATGSTLMNEQSSRSHAIFTVILEQRETADSDVITAKFHFVDLAGSERAKKTGATGQRFIESVRINQGLLALGNVISALGDTKRKSSHIPYRDSKLTRMLQDSLGGNR